MDTLLKETGFSIGLVFGVPGKLLLKEPIMLGVDPREYLLQEGVGPIPFDALEENPAFRGLLWVH